MMDAKKVIEILMDIQSDWECGEEYDAFTAAIKALEKQIPKKPIIREWSPAECPNCGEELSYHLGDGYYQHSDFLERCPNADCAQRLEWK